MERKKLGSVEVQSTAVPSHVHAGAQHPKGELFSALCSSFANLQPYATIGPAAAFHLPVILLGSKLTDSSPSFGVCARMGGRVMGLVLVRLGGILAGMVHRVVRGIKLGE